MTYVTSNLNGDIEYFHKLLDKISFSDSDWMYVLGNIIGVCGDSVELINDLSIRLNVYPIAGAREALALKMLGGIDRMIREQTRPDRKLLLEMADWMENGGRQAVDSFKSLDEDMREGVLEYLSDMPLYEEINAGGKEYVLVSSGIAGFSAGRSLDEYDMEAFTSEPLFPDVAYYDDKAVISGGADINDNSREKAIIGKGSVILRGSCLCLENMQEFAV